MGVGAGYRERNPYRHSSASYNDALHSQDGEVARLQAEIASLKAVIALNPDPLHYEILEHYSTKEAFCLRVRYLGCTNREGVKIMVYRGDIMLLIKHQLLDPHFGSAEGRLFPFARYEPTDEGWRMAKELVNTIDHWKNTKLEVK